MLNLQNFGCAEGLRSVARRGVTLASTELDFLSFSGEFRSEIGLASSGPPPARAIRIAKESRGNFQLHIYNLESKSHLMSCSD